MSWFTWLGVVTFVTRVDFDYLRGKSLASWRRQDLRLRPFKTPLPIFLIDVKMELVSIASASKPAAPE